MKTESVEKFCNTLSGGNKQKVVLAKWMGKGSEIMILDCPTRGIDIGTKASIYQLIEKLKSEGKSILLISEELPGTDRDERQDYYIKRRKAFRRVFKIRRFDRGEVDTKNDIGRQ